MVLPHVWLAPVAAVVCTFISIFSGYIIGVLHGHFPPLLPFVSNGGGYLPEASIFAQFLNMAAFFLVVTAFLRHRQIVEFYAHRLNWEQTRWRTVSLVLMWIGILGAIGTTMVANFRVTELSLVHGIGAIISFVSIVVYGWGQVILGYVLVPRMTSVLVHHFRLILVVLATACVIVHELAAIFKVFIPKSAGPPPGKWQDFLWFEKSSPFYQNFVIASATEWGLTLLMQVFILTFAAEMRLAYPHTPRWIWKNSGCEDENGGLSRWDDHQRVRCIKISPIQPIYAWE